MTLEIRTSATPCRVVAVIENVQPRESDAERTVRGPRAGVAFDAGGAPTKAALGFARGQDVDVDALHRLDVEGVDYVGVVRTDVGRSAVDVLSVVLAQVVVELRADKNMWWNDPHLSFARPIRWLVALLGDVEVPVAVSTLASGRTTRVHRTADTPTVDVPCAEGYLDFLAGHGIVIDSFRRREQMVTAAQHLVAGVGGAVVSWPPSANSLAP